MEKNEIIKNALDIIGDVKSGKKAIRVEASTCGHLVEEWMREYEDNGEDAIVNADEKDVAEAYDECVEYGCEDIDALQVLRHIASKAECHDEHASIDSVNVWEVRHA